MKKTSFSILLLLVLCSILAITPTASHLTTAVDNLASQASLIKTGLIGEDICFRDADFRQALGVTSFPDITVISLPTPEQGVLKIEGLRIRAGQTIGRAVLSRLTFTPASNLVREATFTFRAGNLCGGASLTCSLLLTEKGNAAPSALDDAQTNVSLHTRRNISVFGTLSGYDPEGDDLTYLIVTYPKKGTLTVTDVATGEFRYTPRNGFSGNDTFSYVVRDSYGNYSPVANVHIRVARGVADLDMDAIADLRENAVQYLCTHNILCSSSTKWNEDAPLSRAAFVCAAMKATGHLNCEGSETFFDDNAKISVAARPYIAEAFAQGYIDAILSDEGLCFEPSRSITVSEAHDILSRMLPQTALSVQKTTETNTPLSAIRAALLLYRAATSY